MKIRNGFVSNSSSSSFMIKRYYLSDKQIEDIQNHIEVAKECYNDKWIDDSDRWYVDVDDKYVVVSTPMDNFDMCYFLLNCIGVKEYYIKGV